MRVIVVGGGIVGASAAHHLGRAGVEVVVIDRDDPGKATRAGAGIVCPWPSAGEDGPVFDLYAAGAAFYPELLDDLVGGTGADRSDDPSVDLGYRRVGALVVPSGAAGPDGGPGLDGWAELDAAAARLARRADANPAMGAVERLDSDRARALFPPLRPGLEALHIEGGARVDGRLLAEALLARSRAERVVTPASAEVVLDGDRVAGVRVGGDRPGGGGGGGELVAGDAVVVAGGAWTGDVLAPVAAELDLDLRVDVAPQKGQIIHLGVDDDTSGWPVVLPTGPHYLLAFDDGRVVVGATRETGSGFDVRVTAAGQAQVLGEALAVAPGLADAVVLETRVGLRPLAEGAPTLSAVPGVDGLVVATGLGAGGLTMGPLAGRVAADLVTGATPPVDVSPFALSSPSPPPSR